MCAIVSEYFNNEKENGLFEQTKQNRMFCVRVWITLSGF